MKSAFRGKAIALVGVIAALLIGLSSIDGLVNERRARQQEAQASVADALAGAQTLQGPMLRRQCSETWEVEELVDKTRKLVPQRRDFTLTAWPASVDVQATVGIEARFRGLFKINSYLSNIQMQATWPELLALQGAAKHKGGRVQCEAVQVSLTLSDARGIRSASVQQAGTALALRPGSLLKKGASGFQAELAAHKEGEPLRLDLALELAGTQQFAWVPVGGQTRVKLTSNWPHPSFTGRYLPTQREVSAQGFHALWQVNALASGCEPVKAEAAGCAEQFGVSFIDPVNAYSLSDRALKYGVLFIVLSFIAVGLIEVLKRLRVHPMQYLLVGCALVVFFMLLLSLSEHLPFAQAYLCAAGACTALLTYYASHVLAGWRAGLAFGAGIGLLYAALYALLQLEQTALVMGALLLFAVLSAVIVATRKLNWYTLGAPASQPAAAAHA